MSHYYLMSSPSPSWTSVQKIAAIMNEPNSPGEPNAIQTNTFTCFSRLPLEIRTIIWNFVCFLTRDKDLRFPKIGTMTFCMNGHRAGINIYGYRSTTPHPATIYINWDANRLCLIDSRTVLKDGIFIIFVVEWHELDSSGSRVILTALAHSMRNI